MHTGSDQWFRLVEIGTIYRNSVKGTAFEARREPGTPAGTMEYFHMCRISPCTFTGGTKSQIPINGRPITHIAKVAYSDSLDAVAPPPALDPNPMGVAGKDASNVAPRPSGSKYIKGGLAVFILPMAVSSKVKSQWGNLSVKAWQTDSAWRLPKFAVDNAVMVGVSVENGFADGLSQSLWYEGP